MAKQQSDDEQNIKRKARRRFIGAFALTLAVVVILPMMLDSEPKLTGQDIDLRIPPADEVSEFKPKISISSVAALPTSNTMPAVKPHVAPAKVPLVAGGTGTEETGKEQAEVKPKTISRVAEMPAGVAEGFVAQVGAYSNADTAKQELDRLKKWGFKAYTEKAGDMIRVRVGPYADRDKAEKGRLQLEKRGLHPVVMNAKGS